MTKLEEAKTALMDWLNGEVDHIQLVRTKGGYEYVLRWAHDERQHDNEQKPNANERS